MKPTVLSSGFCLTALTLGMLLLFVAVGYEPDISAISPAASQQRTVAASEVKAPMQVLLSDFTATLQRPLFAPLRRPYEAPAEPVVAEPEPPPPEPPPPPAEVAAPDGLLLRGITVSGDIRKVLLITAAQPMGIWMGLGDKIEGWQVNEINFGSAVLQAGEQKITVNLYVDKPNQ